MISVPLQKSHEAQLHPHSITLSLDSLAVSFKTHFFKTDKAVRTHNLFHFTLIFQKSSKKKKKSSNSFQSYASIYSLRRIVTLLEEKTAVLAFGLQNMITFV